VLPDEARFMEIDGVRNARHLGGLRIADGRTTTCRDLFRSGSLHRISPDGLATLQALGVKTIVDLRSQKAGVFPEEIEAVRTRMTGDLPDGTREEPATLPP